MRRPLGRTLALLLLAASPAAAQEDVPSDTVAARDTVAADSLVGAVPDSLVGVIGDSVAVPDDSMFARLAAPLRPAADSLPGDAIVWDRDRIRRSNATTLGELLAEMTRGSALLRADYFGGPHHVLDGPLGPASLDVRIDGRPFVPMIGSQSDLSQILIATIDEVRVERRAAGYVVDLARLRRTDRRAYSRIEAGNGDPDLNTLRLVFANGLGRSFTVRAGFELFDAGNPESDLQGFSGAFAWLPGGGTSGVELSYEQRSFDRSERFDEMGGVRRLALHGRLGLGEHLRLGGWLGQSQRDVDGVEGGASGREDGVPHGGVRLDGLWENGWATALGRVTDGDPLATTEATLDGGFRPLAWLTLTAGGTLGTWEDFDAGEWRVGAEVRVPVGELRIHAEASSGTRGVPYVASDGIRSASMEFDAQSAGVSGRVGPFRLGGRIARQWVDRQLGFGTGFDPPGTIGEEAEVIGLEGSAEIPVLPLSWLWDELAPIRLRGFVRHNSIESTARPLYVPENLVRGQVFFEDSFFEDDLGVRIGVGLDRRDAWLAPAAGVAPGSAVAVAERTGWDFDLGIRIVGVLLFWRYDNIPGYLEEDLPGFEFAPRRQVFGIRWEFFE